MKILINAPFSPENMRLIREAAGELEITYDKSAEADVMIGVPPENAALSRLKWLQIPFAGAEAFCSDPRIPEATVITNATGAFGEVISEYIIGTMLAICRGLFDYRENQKKRLWRDIGKERLLYGSRALILGCGDIGCAAARKLRAFGVTCVGIRRTPRPTEFFNEVYGADALDGQLPGADAVICCLPLTPLTRGLLDRRRLGLLKKDALLVNVGRGAVIDEEALAEALREGRLYGAALDVFREEPLPESSPLWGLPNVVLTPHISGVSFGHSPDTERRIAEICAENLERFRAGAPLKNVVDRAAGYADKTPSR